jgi:glycerol kinase
MPFILSLDQGSSRTRVALFDHRGKSVCWSEARLSTRSPRPDWVEHDPNELLNGTWTAIRSLLQKSGPKKIAAIGIANQRSTLICWDRKTGAPLSQAVSWQDRRTENLLQKWEYPLIKEITGLPLTCYYSATKLSYLLDRIGRRRKNLMVGTINTFLIWHLTKGKSYCTDPTNAQRTLLYNIVQKKWDDQLLRHFKIPENILPEVLPTEGAFGEAAIDGMRIPITASIGDQQASLIGLGGLNAGSANLNYGTGGFFLMNTGSEQLGIPGLLTSVARSNGNQTTYLIEGSVNTVGALFSWLQQVGILKSVAEIDSACQKSKTTVLFLPALSGLAAPHWVGSARGAIFGLTGATQREDIIRGAVEAIAFRMNDIIQAVPDTIKKRIKTIIATGGGTHISSLIQFQADLFGKSIAVAADLESTIRGTAFLAGKGARLTDETTFRFVPIQKTVKPKMHYKEREKQLQKWKRVIDSVSTCGNDT